jgi:hypothetical protein
MGNDEIQSILRQADISATQADYILPNLERAKAGFGSFVFGEDGNSPSGPSISSMNSLIAVVDLLLPMLSPLPCRLIAVNPARLLTSVESSVVTGVRIYDRVLGGKHQ